MSITSGGFLLVSSSHGIAWNDILFFSFLFTPLTIFALFFLLLHSSSLGITQIRGL